MIKNIAAPLQPSEIVMLMSEHYNPKPTTTVLRCLFNSRMRKLGESVVEFVADLIRILEYYYTCQWRDPRVALSLLFLVIVLVSLSQ